MKSDAVMQLLERANPVRGGDVATEPIAEAAADLAHRIARSDGFTPTRRRRPARRWLVVAVAAPALVPTAAAVGELRARTGWFGAAGMTENDESEFLRTEAPDFRAVAAPLVPDVPLPAGASWSDELDRHVQGGRRRPDVRAMSEATPQR
jgi:hypothetical protein